MTRGKNGPDIEFGDPSSRTTDQSGGKEMRKVLTKNPHPILQRVGEVGWAVLSSWADMVLVLFGIGVLGFSFWYRHAFGNVMTFASTANENKFSASEPGRFSAESDEARPGSTMQIDRRLTRLKTTNERESRFFLSLLPQTLL